MSPLPGNGSKDRKHEMTRLKGCGGFSHTYQYFGQKESQCSGGCEFRGKIHKQQVEVKSRSVCLFVHLTPNAKAERG